jgi:hypothetical protein
MRASLCATAASSAIGNQRNLKTQEGIGAADQVGAKLGKPNKQGNDDGCVAFTAESWAGMILPFLWRTSCG